MLVSCGRRREASINLSDVIEYNSESLKLCKIITNLQQSISPSRSPCADNGGELTTWVWPQLIMQLWRDYTDTQNMFSKYSMVGAYQFPPGTAEQWKAASGGGGERRVDQLIAIWPGEAPGTCVFTEQFEKILINCWDCVRVCVCVKKVTYKSISDPAAGNDNPMGGVQAKRIRDHCLEGFFQSIFIRLNVHL